MVFLELFCHDLKDAHFQKQTDTPILCFLIKKQVVWTAQVFDNKVHSSPPYNDISQRKLILNITESK